MKKMLLPCMAAAAILLSGCASICSKSKYNVTISTNTPEAKITVRDPSSGMVLFEGQSPLSIRLKASESFFGSADYLCEVKANGKKRYRSISAELDPWVFGNIIFGGLIGLVVDGATGAMYKLDNNYYVHFYEDEQ